MFDSCHNDNVQAMLAPYVERVLAAANRVEVEEHLKGCAECRQRVELIRDTLKAISVLAHEGYRPSLERHPSPGLLFSYALERSSLPITDIQSVQKHLCCCASCKSEVEALLDIDKSYQERVITVGTSDLVPALKSSRSSSSSGSFECVAPVIPKSVSTPNFWDYWHQISCRVNMSRAIAAGVVGLVLVYALSLTMCGDGSEGGSALEDIAGKTAGAISTLPSPNASSISVILSVEDGQTEQLRYLLSSSDIPFEDADGKVRVPAEYASKAQQLWAEAVERSQNTAAADTVYEAAPEVGYQETYGGSTGNTEQEAAYSQASENAPQQSWENSPAAAAVSEPVYAEPEPEQVSAAASYSKPEPAGDAPVQRPSDSAPKPILRPLHQNVPKVHEVRQAVTSGAAGKQTAVPQNSANRPAPKPAIVTPTSAPVVSANDAVSNEVSVNDNPVMPQVVRMGSQPAVNSVETEDTQIVTPTPRSVYEGSGADDNSAIGSWSNDI